MKTPTILILFLILNAVSSFSQENSFVKFDYKMQPSNKIQIEQLEISAGFEFLKNEKSILSNEFSYSNSFIKYDETLENLANFSRFNSVDYTLKFDYKMAEDIELKSKLNPSANFQSNFGISDISIFGSISIQKK